METPPNNPIPFEAPKPPEWQTRPGLFGIPGSLVFYVTVDNGAVVNHTKLFEAQSGRGAQFAAETFAEELRGKSNVVRVIVTAVVMESRRPTVAARRMVPNGKKVNGRKPG